MIDAPRSAGHNRAEVSGVSSPKVIGVVLAVVYLATPEARKIFAAQGVTPQ
jgi:hypothetical protein